VAALRARVELGEELDRIGVGGDGASNRGDMLRADALQRHGVGWRGSRSLQLIEPAIDAGDARPLVANALFELLPLVDQHRAKPAGIAHRVPDLPQREAQRSEVQNRPSSVT
jgi:hypothetical protein